MDGKRVDARDGFQTAELLHQQAEYLLNDEIAYASSLRDARRTAATLLLVLIGVGIFRFELHRSPGDLLVVPAAAAVIIRVLFLMALAFVLAGAYLVHTERSLLREFTGQSSTGGALSVLYLRDGVYNEFQEKIPIEVLQMKTDGLRLAYRRLRDSNRRVRRRLASGTLCVFAGLSLVLVAFGVYTLTIDLAEGVANVDNAGDDIQIQRPGID